MRIFLSVCKLLWGWTPKLGAPMLLCFCASVHWACEFHLVLCLKHCLKYKHKSILSKAQLAVIFIIMAPCTIPICGCIQNRKLYSFKTNSYISLSIVTQPFPIVCVCIWKYVNYILIRLAYFQVQVASCFAIYSIELHCKQVCFSFVQFAHKPIRWAKSSNYLQKSCVLYL